MGILNVRSKEQKGALVFTDLNGSEGLVVGATTGIPFGFYNQYTVNITAAATLAPSTHYGAIVYCTTDNVVVTLPNTGASTAGAVYRVMNTASDGGALLQIKTGQAADFWVVGGTVTATTNLVLANTKATQQYGDNVTIACAGWASTGLPSGWLVTNMVGTWVAQAAT